MARIRTIKPEFPQSESMGSVSREARLCFILLWTIADDEGRLRADSRLLASLLYPYDGDISKSVTKWLEELSEQKCLVRYEIDGKTYIEIKNWTNHQKIDRPSESKLPTFDESSRILASETRALVLGKEGKGVDQEGTSTIATEEFLSAFRSSYPKRDGPYGWNEDTRKKLRSEKESERPRILRAVDAYRTECEKNGKVGTETVCMIQTFVNQKRWEEYSDPALHPPKCPEPVEGVDYWVHDDGMALRRKEMGSEIDFNLGAWQRAWKIANGVAVA